MDTKNTYTQVDIGDFYDSEKDFSFEKDEGLIVLTANEQTIYTDFLAILREQAPATAKVIANRMDDLTKLAAGIAKFPSLLERHDVTGGGVRTPQLLIDSLIKHQDKGDTTLQLPSKAILGKAYIVSKIHTFASMYRLCGRFNVPEHITQAMHSSTMAMTFMLMAEDVYLNLINDNDLPMDFRRQWAISLLLIWEHRNDQSIESIAPVLQSVWTARRKLAPAFGTMMGTSELLLMSIQMDEQWIQFVKEKMGDPGVAQAMEEFLFGISSEQLLHLRSILKEQSIPAINRDEVSHFLGEHVKADAGLDYRDFYSLYTVRRDNARARSRMKLPGPTKTLEDYFIQFITEQNQAMQRNDSFAK